MYQIVSNYNILFMYIELSALCAYAYVCVREFFP